MDNKNHRNKPGALPEDNNEDGTVIHLSKDYGIGIDCHSRFLQISVIVKCGFDYVEYQKEFSTDPESIDNAHEWVIDTIQKHSSPPICVDADKLSYTIESTSTYHLPLVQRWGGSPEIINPKLAGSTHRKTDKLDATMLSRQNINGMWRESYVPSQDVWALRSLIDQKETFSASATRRSNKINSLLLEFGITVGRDGSITKKQDIRAIVMDLISDNPSDEIRKTYPMELPTEVKDVLRKSYDLYDQDIKQKQEYSKLASQKAQSMMWETSDSKLSGTEMLKLLTTVPGIGSETAVVWMANVITPRRFPNAKAISAYCGLDPSLKISAKHVVSTVKRGGNKTLHSKLCFSASGLMGRHTEPFGIWGYKLFQATGKWKKGTNAIARRLAISLYYVQSTGLPFDYSQYTIMTMPKVIDMPVADLVAINPEFHRYLSGFHQANIRSTQDLVDRYHNGALKRLKGLSGIRLNGLVKEFIQKQDRYEKLFAEYSSRRIMINEIVARTNWSVEELAQRYPKFHRYISALTNAGIPNCLSLIQAYYDGLLTDYPRLGTTFVSLIDDFISKEIANNERKD